MSDDWFSYQLAPDGDVEDGCHPEEAQAMKDYLRQRTTAIEAAQAITHPIATADNPSDDLSRLWALLMNSFLELPAEHTESLLELLKTIESLPEPDFTAVDKLNRPYEKLWKGLCGFGHHWYDSYRAGCWRNDVAATKSPERDALRDTHVRKAEIEAQFVMADIGNFPIDWGYEAVADALESSDAVLDFEVPAAARWLVTCSQRFRQGAENGEKLEGQPLRPRIKPSSKDPSGDLWKVSSDRAMSLGRWSWWEGRLRELQGEQGIVKDAATTALDAMRNAVHAPS